MDLISHDKQQALPCNGVYYQDNEGNAVCAAIEHIATELRTGQNMIVDRLDAMERRHAVNEAAIANFQNAFPKGDADGHRRYHETVVEMLEEKRKLRMAIQEKTVSGLVWAGIVAVGTAIWHELTRSFGLK